MTRSRALVIASLLAMSVFMPMPLAAEQIANPVAVFSGLDKITAAITSFKVPLNQTHQFGQLEVTPRVCYSRPPTEEPNTSTFVEVDEIEENGSKKRIFSGWMFAESPGLHAVEHPVYDVWLTGCIDPNKPATPNAEGQTDGGDDSGAQEIPKDTD